MSQPVQVGILALGVAAGGALHQAWTRLDAWLWPVLPAPAPGCELAERCLARLDEALVPTASSEGWIFGAGFVSALAVALVVGLASWEYRARSLTTGAPLSIEDGARASSAQANNAIVVSASAPRRRGLGRLEAPVAGS